MGPGTTGGGRCGARGARTAGGIGTGRRVRAGLRAGRRIRAGLGAGRRIRARLGTGHRVRPGLGINLGRSAEGMAGSVAGLDIPTVTSFGLEGTTGFIGSRGRGPI